MTGDERFTLWRDDLPPWLSREQVAIPPGAIRPCSNPMWRDAIVVVEHGTVVLAGSGGRQVRLTEGAVFCLAGVGRATLRNTEDTTAMLSVGRRPRSGDSTREPDSQRAMKPHERVVSWRQPSIEGSTTMTTTEPLVTGVDFVAVPTDDFESSVRFYGEVLGLPCIERYGDMPGAEFQAGNLTLAVMENTAFGQPFSPNSMVIALHVADVDAARARLEAAGVEFTTETFDSGVCHQAIFLDPAGNPLDLHHRYAPPKPGGAGG